MSRHRIPIVLPEEPRLYRHRGHRYITVRRFDAAVSDLERAAALVAGRPDEVEPDGLPNERNVPTGTLQSNIWYHLGLARYLERDFEGESARSELGWSPERADPESEPSRRRQRAKREDRGSNLDSSIRDSALEGV